MIIRDNAGFVVRASLLKLEFAANVEAVESHTLIFAL